MVTGGGSAEELKRALEWELSLDNNDLRSHAWYHGTIPRNRAEELMSGDGEFLIRDCISRPGDYVLTCRWKTSSLHFVINKVVFQPFTVYEKIQYQFEDDCFDTVPDLVTYYVGNKRPISAASGAVISKPVNRSMPLSYYATRYGLECQMHYAALVEKNSSVEQPLPPEEESPVSRVSTPGDYPRKPNFSTLPYHSKVTPPATPGGTLDIKNAKIRSSQEQQQQQQSSVTETPPPKPSRIPSKKYSTIPYSSGTTTPGVENGIQSSGSNNAVSSATHLYSELNFTSDDAQKPQQSHQDGCSGSNIRIATLGRGGGGHLREITVPDSNPPSSFDLEKFTTVLLPPSENKPLDSSALAKMRCMILEGGSKVIASHLTKVDLDVLKMTGCGDLGMGVLTGFELLVLPQGQQLRLDLLERTECLKFFVAVTILTCGDEEVRSQVLNKWIQIAIETKTALGNLYGFTGIMQGLAIEQISRLRCTWLKLRQTCTENAFTYETKLRPTLKSMQECSNPQAPNTCIPYLMSLIHILQRHQQHQQGEVEVEEVQEVEQPPAVIPYENPLSLSHKEKGKVLSLGLGWEQTAADYGLQLLLTHLEVGRNCTQHWPTYKRNSEIVMEHVKWDDIMLDMFRTEMHMKFLWGSKGAHVHPKERYSKFNQVLNVMSERCEPPLN